MIKKLFFSVCALVFVLACEMRSGSTSIENLDDGIDTTESLFSAENSSIRQEIGVLDTFEHCVNSSIPSTIRDRVYYQVRQSDSGQHVFKCFHTGFSGFRFEDDKQKNFGFETFELEIDSVQDLEFGYQVFTSNTYLDVFEREQVDTFSFVLSFVAGKEGLLLFNQEWLFVDSVFLSESLIPVVEEEPYDIDEAWANDPANQ